MKYTKQNTSPVQEQNLGDFLFSFISVSAFVFARPQQKMIFQMNPMTALGITLLTLKNIQEHPAQLMGMTIMSSITNCSSLRYRMLQHIHYIILIISHY